MATQPPQGKKPGGGPALLDRILDPANLAAAWEEVAENAGAPGADRISIRRFGRAWEEHAQRLAQTVRDGSYRPGRLRVTTIPKADGGVREIAIPTVADRLLQRATLEALMPRIDRKFLSCSYGYRPRRGVAQAVAAVIRYRERGLRWAAEADIDDCFGSLDHGVLLPLIRAEVSDPRVMALIEMWLALGRPSPDVACGVPLGMPLSPLWANLYLHQMDWRLMRNRWTLVRYADDFVVLAQTEAQAERALEVVAAALADLKLRLEPTKTRVSNFDDGFEFLGVRFQGDEYSFTWREKRITVEGKFNWLWGQYVEEPY